MKFGNDKTGEQGAVRHPYSAGFAICSARGMGDSWSYLVLTPNIKASEAANIALRTPWGE